MSINDNLELTIKDRTRELENKNKALEEYAFITAHKLRAPLASILGRVKETLFNKLMSYMEGARVLDLFSGTGNLGIEAISRGAEWVDLVESHPKSVQIIRDNLAQFKITDGCKVFPVDVFKYIKGYSGKPYDVILADPPFTKTLADTVMASKTCAVRMVL